MDVVHVARFVIVISAARIGVYRPRLPIGAPCELDDIRDRVRFRHKDLPAIVFVEGLPLHDGRVVATAADHGYQVGLEERDRRIRRATVLLHRVLRHQHAEPTQRRLKARQTPSKAKQRPSEDQSEAFTPVGGVHTCITSTPRRSAA